MAGLSIFNEDFSDLEYVGYESTEENLALCDYYQGVGSCTFGCQEEPACMTDCPRGGWPEILWTSQEANVLAGRRYTYRMQNWLGWQHLKRFLEKDA